MKAPLLVVYGKIILDSIRLPAGETVTGLLGGGGPQATLGARLFADAVGLLSRTGADLDRAQAKALRSLGADLEGWRQYAHLRTPRLHMTYDEDQNMLDAEGKPIPIVRWEGNWSALLSEVIAWPESYRRARAVHLVTEIPDEVMVRQALALRAETGAWLSLEPLIDINEWSNLDGMRALASRADVVCPDLPSALRVAQTDDPAAAAAYWHALGPRFVAVRAGPRGSFLAGRGLDGVLRVPPVRVEVKDPTGAGNAYAGALIASLAQGESLALAGCKATAAAALLLETVGTPAYAPALAQRAQAQAQVLYASLPAGDGMVAGRRGSVAA